jgi:hypothetical protein
MWVACGLLDETVNQCPVDGAIEARYPLPREPGTTARCGRTVDDLLTKMHESNPPPKNHNKKILSSFWKEEPPVETL